MTATYAKPKAYNYVRFSTPEQAEGDSYRRQTEAAAAYARTTGLELDGELTYADLGVSAFNGANAKTGALAAFLEAVKSGTVEKGSYLLIENLDRLTRADILEAQELFTGIIRRGITLVTLSDDRTYSTESIIANPVELIIAILTMMRGREESATKSHRLRSAYERKRRDAATGTEQTPFSRMLPAWLRWNEESGRYEVIKKRAVILRDIFAKADNGWSKRRIARYLHDAGVETWDNRERRHSRWRKDRVWHTSYIHKLLTNPAVIGTFTPHSLTKTEDGKRKRTALAPIENHWPVVVDREVFARVSAQARARAARGKYADNKPLSLFAGLLMCARCGSTVSRVAKGRYTYLVCSKAHTVTGCEYLAVRYEDAEGAVVARAEGLQEWAPRGKATAEIEAEIERLSSNLDAGWTIARDLADMVARDKSEAARQRLREVETELADTERELQRIRTQRDTMADRAVLRRIDAIEQALTRKPLIIMEANKTLKQAVTKIVMDAQQGTLTFHWHHAKEPSHPIYLASRHKRWENEPPAPPK